MDVVTSLVHVPEERMTARARAYLLTAAARHIAVGVTCILAPGEFASPSYAAIKGVLPVDGTYAITMWGILFGATGLLCAFAAAAGRAGEARWALLASVLTSALWAAGFVAELRYSGAPTGPIIWTAVTIKDITMLRSPLRNPFEPVIRRALDRDRTQG